MQQETDHIMLHTWEGGWGCGGCFPCDTGISQVGGCAHPMGPHPSTTYRHIYTYLYVCILSSPCQIAGKWCTFNNVPCHVHWFIEIKTLQHWRWDGGTLFVLYQKVYVLNEGVLVHTTPLANIYVYACMYTYIVSVKFVLIYSILYHILNITEANFVCCVRYLPVDTRVCMSVCPCVCSQNYTGAFSSI